MTATQDHFVIIDYWPRTDTTPEEVFVQCACGRFEFTSQESISGGIEPWGEAWDAHLEEEQ